MVSLLPSIFASRHIVPILSFNVFLSHRNWGLSWIIRMLWSFSQWSNIKQIFSKSIWCRLLINLALDTSLQPVEQNITSQLLKHTIVIVFIIGQGPSTRRIVVFCAPDPHTNKPPFPLNKNCILEWDWHVVFHHPSVRLDFSSEVNNSVCHTFISISSKCKL